MEVIEVMEFKGIVAVMAVMGSCEVMGHVRSRGDEFVGLWGVIMKWLLQKEP